ncbi:putative phosphonate metabolism protein [Cohaesibacter sp. ES.047]|uniref:DUF1045 domain-containing protein n=1 Tax=Cohaesibacter sp. ES.047 TaxID=1798205 RepID=UPI000BB881BB|nr:DUF1045 domain-containing protein [Cohaesibacter sp. ES.047]SNY92868.1 putative phosphonate metabolism protein [Cohaesibacter sp. ES.047]
MLRYAIYFVPLSGNPLNEAAAQWLGRDVFTGVPIDRASPVADADDETFQSLTQSPRRYGFHGTLKAPFELAEGRTIEAFADAVEAHAKTLAPFALPQFRVGQLGPFFALLPTERSEPLAALASDLVIRFDGFRAPLSAADIARRDPDKLSASQRGNLLNWGYPYVLDDFSFHMTLTNPVPDALSQAFQTAACRHFEPFMAEPQSVDALSVFVEPERGAPFSLYKQFPIG